MAKTTYRKAKRTARKNPTLLTLVNPSKKPKKAKKPKTAAQLRAQKKAVPSSQRAATQKALRGVAPAKGKRRPSGRKVGGRSYVGGTKGLRAGQKPKRPGFKGRRGDVAPSRRKGPGQQKYRTPGGRKAARSLPSPGYSWVTDHDRSTVDDGVSGYWRFQENEGEDMYGRRKIRRRRRNAKRPVRRGPKGRFVGRKNPVRRRTKRAPMRRNKPLTKAKRSAAAKKAARTRAANKRKRSAAAKKGARTRKRGTRKVTRKPAKRRTRRAAPKRRVRKNRRVYRSKGKRYVYRNKGRKRPVRRRRRRYGRKNPLPILAKEIAVGFIGFLGGRLVANLVGQATFIPASMRPYSPLLGTAAAVGLAYYLPKKVKALKPYRSTLLLGTGIAMADVLFSSLAPANIRAYVGAPPPVALPGAMGQDLSVYEAALRGWGGPPVWLDESGDWGQQPLLPGREYPVTRAMSGMGATVQEAMAEYIEEPMGEYVEEPLSEYIEEPLAMDEDGALITGNEELDAGVVTDSLFGGGDEDVDILALDDVPFDGDQAAQAANAAAQVANAGARAGRPVREVMVAAHNAACQAMGTTRLNALVKRAVAAQVAKAMGRVQSFVPRADPMQGAPMAVGPMRPAKPVKWTYGEVNESGGIFAKGPFG